MSMKKMKTCIPIIHFVRSMARRAKNAQSRNPRHAMSEYEQAKTNVISKGDKEIIIKVKDLHNSSHYSANISSFENLMFRNDIVQALEHMKIAQPTIIQMLAIPQIMEGKNIFCAAQTGSGKTVVYAAPIIQNIKNEVDGGFIGRLSRPRALVVAPARELAMQILAVFKSFSHFTPFRSVGLIGQTQKKWTRDYMKGLVDVVVGTPTTIVKYHHKGWLNLSDLQYLVLDEADTLMDENFSDSTINLLNLCHFHNLDSAKKPVQCILTAATLPPKGILSNYKKYIPNLEVCQSNLHKVLPQVEHIFVKTKQEDKLDLLTSKLIKFMYRDFRKCIIFCNTSKACNWVSIKLNENNTKHSKLHGNMNPQVRIQDFKTFFSGDNRVLVCTDIASRGLDTTDVTLVINFDCPFNTSDYIHRSGRTGRARQTYHREAQVVTFITQNKEVLFARKIQNAAEKNEELLDVKIKKNSLKEKYLRSLKEYRENKAEV